MDLNILRVLPASRNNLFYLTGVNGMKVKYDCYLIAFEVTPTSYGYSMFIHQKMSRCACVGEKRLHVLYPNRHRMEASKRSKKRR